MMVVFDSNMLLLLIRPDAGTPKDSKGVPITHAVERVEGLIAQLSRDKTKIVIPTPVLAEVLVRSTAEARAVYVERFRRSAAFRIEPFDERAAIEVAAMERKAHDAGDKKGGSDQTWAKVKYDRQIVGTAKVIGAQVIYTDDGNLAKCAFANGMRAIGLSAVQIPTASAQIPLFPGKRAIDLGDDEPGVEA